jgi:hypothetical protein
LAIGINGIVPFNRKMIPNKNVWILFLTDGRAQFPCGQAAAAAAEGRLISEYPSYIKQLALVQYLR